MGVLGGAATVAVGGGAAAAEGWMIPTHLLDVGPWGLLLGTVAFIFYGVFKGWIVPKPHYDTLMARALAAEDSNKQLLSNNTDLAQAALKTTIVGDTVERLVTAIQDTRQKAGDAP